MARTSSEPAQSSPEPGETEKDGLTDDFLCFYLHKEIGLIEDHEKGVWVPFDQIESHLILASVA